MGASRKGKRANGEYLPWRCEALPQFQRLPLPETGNSCVAGNPVKAACPVRTREEHAGCVASGGGAGRRQICRGSVRSFQVAIAKGGRALYGVTAR